MHTAEVVPGMKGYGLSVFRGTAIERFDVEVISVLRNQDGPDHNVVLIRCRGQGLEHSGAIEGMSGSPIFLTDKAGHDRMIGAFALGWEGSKDPIAGVRPIEEMLDVPATAVPGDVPTVKAAVTRWDALPLLKTTRRPTPVTAEPRAATGLTRLALPLTVAGVGDDGFAALAPWLRQGGLVPLQGGAVAGTDADPNAKLEPGAAIALPIVTGDLDLSALGTVTEVIGDKIYAFGHQYNAEGGVDLPMGVGFVHTVIPSSTISFKIGALLHLDGAIRNDEATGIAGTIGRVPAMIPMTVSVKTPQRPDETTYHFQVARHPKLTPMGVVTSLLAGITGHSNLPTDFTVRYTMKMTFDDGHTLDLSDTASSATQAEQLARDVNLPMTLALSNPFRRTYPARISARFDVRPEAELDEIKSAVPDRTVYKPGDTAHLSVTTIMHHGGERMREVAFVIPDDVADGPYTLTVGDADRYVADEMRVSPYKFEVRNLDEVFGLAAELTKRPSQQLYVRLTSHTEGVALGRTPLAGMPASRLRVLSRAGRGDVLPYVPSYGQAYPSDVPVHGSTDVELAVSATPDKVARPASATATVVPPALPKAAGLPAPKDED